MKAFVDKDSCIGCSLCESICPRVFRMNGDGVAKAIETDVEKSMEDEVLEAEAQCPVNAIRIEGR